MFVYKIDSIRSSTFSSRSQVQEKVEDRINEWAELGWELVQVVSNAHGLSSCAEMIFRQEVESKAEAAKLRVPVKFNF